MKEIEHFRSIDSAPPAYSVSRSAWVTPGFLAMFTVVAGILLAHDPDLQHYYALALTHIAPQAHVSMSQPLTLGLRPFYIAVFVTLPVFLSGSVFRRLGFMLLLCASYMGLTLCFDRLWLNLNPSGRPGPLTVAENIVLAYLGFLMLGVAVLAAFQLPSDEMITPEIRRSRRFSIVFATGTIVSGVGAVLAAQHAGASLQTLREVSLLGGIGPGVMLFKVLLIPLLAVAGFVSLRRQPTEEATYSVGFLVPAFNEASNIAETIRSLDGAAGNYRGTCHLYVVDNNSSDDTRDVAERTLAQCEFLSGEVLLCLEPGKAKALNYGLEHIREEIVIRVDADTLLSPHILAMTLAYFAEPRVGAVGGMPAPKDASHLLGRMRNIEVHESIGLQRLYLNAVDAVLAVAGYYAVFRRDCIQKVGGFVEDMNGEDTDLAVRVGRLGYRVVSDPRLRIYSEVPSSFRHFREQRLRWYRSTFHVASRNKSAMWRLQGVRGAWALPWQVLGASRRVFLIPIVIYAMLIAFLAPTELSLQNGASFIALIAGTQYVITICALVAYGRMDLMPFLPTYLGFRVLRWYLSLEMLFTMPLKGKRSKSPEGRPAAIASGQPAGSPSRTPWPDQHASGTTT